MKKKLVFGIAAVCILLLAGCKSAPQKEQAGLQKDLGKVLILYYTWSEQANTENAAKIIQGLTGADLVKVEPETPFPELGNDEFIAWGREQMENQALPEIKDPGVDLASYDFIFIGTPVWYGSVSFPIESLLLKTDFGGKPVACFAMAGGGAGEVLSNFESKVQNGEVKEGIALQMREETEAESKITQWVKGL